MTRYWPLSTLRDSPLMPAPFQWELARFCEYVPSEPAFQACLRVAHQMAPVPMRGLAIVESEDAPMRLVYTEMPDLGEWLRLERVFAAGNDNGRLFLTMEALH